MQPRGKKVTELDLDASGFQVLRLLSGHKYPLFSYPCIFTRAPEIFRIDP